LAVDVGMLMSRCASRRKRRVVQNGRVIYKRVEGEKWAVAIGAIVGCNVELMGMVAYNFMLHTKKGLMDFMLFKP